MNFSLSPPFSSYSVTHVCSQTSSCLPLCHCPQSRLTSYPPMLFNNRDALELCPLAINSVKAVLLYFAHGILQFLNPAVCLEAMQIRANHPHIYLNISVYLHSPAKGVTKQKQKKKHLIYKIS